MPDVGTRALIARFYAPLHYLIPILVAGLRATDAVSRRRAIITTVTDCGISMILAFALAIWLAAEDLSWAAGVLLLLMFLPYPRALRKPAAMTKEPVLTNPEIARCPPTAHCNLRAGRDV